METENQPQQSLTSNQDLLTKLASDERTKHLRPAEMKGTLQISDIELCDSVMYDIWSKMIDTYGNKWIDNFGLFCNEHGVMNSTVHHWAQALSRIPLNRIERGLMKCFQERESPFPPTLPEFYKLCAKEPWE